MTTLPYTELFAMFGRRLAAQDAVPPQAIDKAETGLQATVPDALRDFYLQAGNARDFIAVYDQFLAPSEWGVQDGRLIFVEENQDVVRYGVDCSADAPADPPVWIATTGATLEWHPASDTCSGFIAAMLAWQAAFGEALPFTGSGLATPAAAAALAGGDWHHLGTVNGMSAYLRPGQAVCQVEWDDGVRLFVGALTDESFWALEDLLGVDLETHD